VGALARPHGHQRECWAHEQGKHGERHVDEQQHHRHEDKGEDVHEHEDEAVAQEEPHGLQIACCPRHQLPNGHAVEVTERQALQMREHEVAQVELNGEAHVASHDAAHQREDGPHHPDDDHGDDEWQEGVLLLPVQHIINDPAREVWQGDRAGHQDERGDRRDDDRPLVRPEECEQPDERAQRRFR
jgi:hypothetical protein